jgi:hypothetical protein
VALAWLQGTLVGFDVNVPVEGDVILGLSLADHRAQWDTPALAYAIHTSFVTPGVTRVTGHDVEVPAAAPGLKSATTGPDFFMDVTFEETLDEAAPQPHGVGNRGPLGHPDLVDMRERWRSLVDGPSGQSAGESPVDILAFPTQCHMDVQLKPVLSHVSARTDVTRSKGLCCYNPRNVYMQMRMLPCLDSYGSC